MTMLPKRSRTSLIGLLLLATVVLLLSGDSEASSRVGFSVARPPVPKPLRSRHGRRSCAAPAQVLKADGHGFGFGFALRGFMKRVLALLSLLTWWGRSTTKALKAAPVLETESSDWEPEVSQPVAVHSVQVAPFQAAETLAPVAQQAEEAIVVDLQDAEPAMAVACETEVAALADPVVPGMDKANLVVKVETVPGKQATTEAEATMAQSNQGVMENLCGEGWSCRPIDVENDLFEITLPSVRYQLPMGVVSIPAPLFHAQVRNSETVSGDYKERLIADIVLQNGDKMLCVELGFPFSSKFTISAAGWARCRVGREPESVICKADVEMGLQVPKVPGLTSILQFFVKSYANKSAHDCAVSLSKKSGL